MRQQAYEVLDGLIKSNNNSGNGGGLINEDSIYIINAEDGEDLGASGSSYNLYSELSGQLIPNHGCTLEQFEEIYGMSFMDFYNNVKAIQIIKKMNGEYDLFGFATIIVPTDGKTHQIINHEGQSFEIYIIKFTKTIITGWMDNLFSVNFKFTYSVNDSAVMCELDIVDYEIK